MSADTSQRDTIRELRQTLEAKERQLQDAVGASSAAQEEAAPDPLAAQVALLQEQIEAQNTQIAILLSNQMVPRAPSPPAPPTPTLPSHRDLAIEILVGATSQQSSIERSVRRISPYLARISLRSSFITA